MLGVRLAGQHLGQAAAHAFDDRAVQQEPAHVRGLRVEDLLGQIARDGLVVAGEVGHLAVRLVPLQEEGGQPQAGGPALSAVDEQLGVVGAHRHPVRLEQGTGLRRVEGQVTLPDLGQLLADPQPVQRQGGVGPGEQDQVQPVQAVPEQLGHLGEDSGRVDELEVVEDDRDIARQGGQPGQQPPEVLVLGPVPGGQVGEWVVRRNPARRPQRGDEVRPEALGVVVAPVEGHPGHPLDCRPCGRPVRRGERLSPAGPGAHHGQRATGARLQQPVHPAAGHVRRRHAGSRELGAEQIEVRIGGRQDLRLRLRRRHRPPLRPPASAPAQQLRLTLNG